MLPLLASGHARRDVLSDNRGGAIRCDKIRSLYLVNNTGSGVGSRSWVDIRRYAALRP